VNITANFAVVAVTGVSIGDYNINLQVGGSYSQLSYQVTPSDALINTVVWATGNTAIATVDNYAIKAVGVGTTTVTVSINGVVSNARQINVTHAANLIGIDFDIRRDVVFVITGLPSGNPVLLPNGVQFTLTGYDSNPVEWHLNGEEVSQTASYTLDASGLKLGVIHKLSVIVTVGGHMYSRVIEFEVQP
jgi:hypothetical protein